MITAMTVLLLASTTPAAPPPELAGRVVSQLAHGQLVLKHETLGFRLGLPVDFVRADDLSERAEKRHVDAYARPGRSSLVTTTATLLARPLDREGLQAVLEAWAADLKANYPSLEQTALKVRWDEAGGDGVITIKMEGPDGTIFGSARVLHRRRGSAGRVYLLLVATFSDRPQLPRTIPDTLEW